MAPQTSELFVHALRVERSCAGNPIDAIGARQVRGDDEVCAEVSVDVRDDGVLVPRARRMVLAEEDFAVCAAVDPGEAFVGIDYFGIAVGFEGEYRLNRQL